MSLFRSRKDLIIKVFNGGDDDDAYIFAVNGEIVVDKLAEIEDELKGEHEFSSGPGEYTYEAVYDDGQYDDMGRCEISPGWELTEVSFEKPEWMSMSHEPQELQFKDEPCPKCGISDISCLCCIPF
jgi:hypothetical protein